MTLTEKQAKRLEELREMRATQREPVVTRPGDGWPYWFPFIRADHWRGFARMISAEAPRVEWGNYDDGTDSQPDVSANDVTLRATLANDHLKGREAEITGYYTDREFQDETLCPIVVRLSHGRALAGYTYGPGMSFSIDRTTVYHADPDEAGQYATQRDAARAAHEYARIAAEAECDYQNIRREAEQRAGRGVACVLMNLRRQWVIAHVEDVPRYVSHGWEVSETFGDDLRKFIVRETRTYEVWATDEESAKAVSVEPSEGTLVDHTATLADTDDVGKCRWCGRPVHFEEGALVDDTGSDVCGTREAQDETATGTNPPHQRDPREAPDDE